MATYSLFAAQIERISSCFQSKFYGKERFELIWAKIRLVGDEDLVYIFNHAISNFRYAPTPQEFSDIKRSLGIQDIKNKDEVTSCECPLCDSDGRVFASSDNGVTEKVFKCVCRNADQYPNYLIKWINRDRRKSWKLVRTILLDEAIETNAKRELLSSFNIKKQ